VSGDFRKRNRELKRVRAFIGRKNTKKEFEELYIKAYDYFYSQALECENICRKGCSSPDNPHLGYCHGMYNQHSVLFLREEGNEIATINFDRFYAGNQLDDLYHFMRKVLEKNNYDFSLMQAMMERYSSVCPLSGEDIDYIYTLFCYPEKFYKISNQYINAPKNLISPKMLEKLLRVTRDEEQKNRLLIDLKNYKSQLKSI
jgi:spore coat protein I